MKLRVIAGVLLGVVIDVAWSAFSRLTTAQFKVLVQQHAPATLLRHAQGAISLFWLRWWPLLGVVIPIACPLLVELGYRLWWQRRTSGDR